MNATSKAVVILPLATPAGRLGSSRCPTGRLGAGIVIVPTATAPTVAKASYDTLRMEGA